MFLDILDMLHHVGNLLTLHFEESLDALPLLRVEGDGGLGLSGALVHPFLPVLHLGVHLFDAAVQEPKLVVDGLQIPLHLLLAV